MKRTSRMRAVMVGVLAALLCLAWGFVILNWPRKNFDAKVTTASVLCLASILLVFHCWTEVWSRRRSR